LYFNRAHCRYIQQRLDIVQIQRFDIYESPALGRASAHNHSRPTMRFCRLSSVAVWPPAIRLESTDSSPDRRGKQSRLAISRNAFLANAYSAWLFFLAARPAGGLLRGIRGGARIIRSTPKVADLNFYAPLPFTAQNLSRNFQLMKTSLAGSSIVHTSRRGLLSRLAKIS
jgi:hypothetical protein